jgi:acetyl-CoA C-acetyltransferase
LFELREIKLSEAYILAATRTAGGRKGGKLATWHPADLAAHVLDALVARLDADPALIDDVIVGCVGQAGEQALNIGRKAVLASKLPLETPGVSVDRQCGSSQQAIHFAAQAVMSGAMDIVIAAGVESMSRVPMGLTTKVLEQQGFGSSVSPGMAQRFPNVVFSQFAGAEMLATKHGLTRDELDAFALSSHQKAAAAVNSGAFDREIVPTQTGTGETHSVDEGIRFDATLEGIRGVKTIQPDGLLTPASSSQICDGAAGIVVANERGLKALQATPLARIHHMTVLGGDPVIMLEAPIAATERALSRSGLAIDDIDALEVNEAFASVPLAWLKATKADPARLNVNGGAIALGHPLGGSGAKLMATLVYALHARGGRFGLQTMCEGGGLANVTIVERL